MKNITEHVGRLKLVRRLKNSHVGNPQFELAIIEPRAQSGLDIQNAQKFNDWLFYPELFK